jgi:hypothetical protein
MARKFVVSTPYGSRYYIHDQGEIECANGKNGAGSASWRMLGLSSTHSRQFGKMAVHFEDLDDWLKTAPEILYGNGKPRYTMIDLDHGTQRTHGNTKVHGVSAIRAYIEY